MKSISDRYKSPAYPAYLIQIWDKLEAKIKHDFLEYYKAEKMELSNKLFRNMNAFWLNFFVMLFLCLKWIYL